MAGGREIKSKIKSVQNTRKVTRALEMVSASKIRKAQDRMKASRPGGLPFVRRCSCASASIFSSLAVSDEAAT